MGLSLARETGWICAWNAHHWLFLLNPHGQRQAQVCFPQPITDAAVADDGSLLVVAGQGGLVRALAPDLSTLWEMSGPTPWLSLALDHLGEAAALADRQGSLQLLDKRGKTIATGQSPRPLHHLAMDPTAARVLGAADFGLLAAFDGAGKILWREAPVVNVGALGVSAVGSPIYLACFSEGLCRYDRVGKPQKNLATPEPARLVSPALDGECILVGGLTNQLFFLNRQGELLGQHQPVAAIHGLALGALSQECYAALADGTVVKYRLEGAPRPKT